MYNTISSAKDNKDLQKDLDELTKWQDRWQMRFNASKCYVMHISSAKNIQTFKYKLCGQTLEAVDSHPYLGIHLQNDMKWDTQVAHATSKASRILGLIKRNLYHCSELLKSTAYTSLVRPHTEYGSTSWDPYTKAHSDQLEKAQRSAAHFVKRNYTKEEGTVANILRELDWPTLQQRRSQARLTLMYKIINQLVDIPSDQYLTPVTRQGLRRKDSNFLKPHSRVDVYKYSFFPWTIDEWNLLPKSTVQATTINSFNWTNCINPPHMPDLHAHLWALSVHEQKQKQRSKKEALHWNSIVTTTPWVSLRSKIKYNHVAM